MLPIIAMWGTGAAVASIAVSVSVLRARREKRRTEALAELATRLGFDFNPLQSDGGELRNAALFKKGRDARVTNFIVGTTEGLGLCIFDLRYLTGQGKSTEVHEQTVIALREPRGSSYPSFVMEPESLSDKIFFSADIDFESHRAFSKRYLLHGENVDAIRALFQPPVLDHFETGPDWYLEGFGTFLVCYRLRPRGLFLSRASRLEPAEIPGAIDEVKRHSVVLATARDHRRVVGPILH